MFPERLTRAASYLADQLEAHGEPVLTPFSFFRIVWQMYAESPGKKLYLRHKIPDQEDYARLRSILKTSGFIRTDRDYGNRAIRVMSVPDKPAEDIICLIDPTCYLSHLSAMQRWGLTNRNPKALILTRPDRQTAKAQLRDHMNSVLDENEHNPFSLNIISHPNRVRRRSVRVYESKTAGASIKNRSDDVRLSTIGQTFLDMLQKPDLCGGMSHILDVWEEHAETYLSDVIDSVDTAKSNLVKSRAGYILEERLGLHHSKINKWKALGQRGSSRKLDPAKKFAPTFSETWMISLNV